MKRNRLIYSFLIILTIILGLLSRSSMIPKMIYPYLGDFLYALMYFFIVGFFFSEKTPLKVALISILICYFIELTQLYQSNWINTIRSYKIGGLILGYGFLWSDMISYTLGGVSGYLLEKATRKDREVL